MFWQLLCAHLAADFPLQPNWMVRRKREVGILLLHVSVHFAAMAALIYPASRQAWPALLALAAVHFAIDAGKNWLTVQRPAWVIWPYFVDQALHVLSLIFLSAWLDAYRPGVMAALPRSAAVVASGFLLVTFVWRVTELILRRSRPGDTSEADSSLWLRLGYRALLLAVLLLGWSLMNGRRLSMAEAPAAILLAYPNNRAGRLALAADLILTTLVAVLVIELVKGIL